MKDTDPVASTSVGVLSDGFRGGDSWLTNGTIGLLDFDPMGQHRGRRTSSERTQVREQTFGRLESYRCANAGQRNDSS
jgi:hypothetical protein